MKKITNIVRVIAVMLCLGSAYAEKPFKVIVCAGQSNMLGKCSKASELPKELQGSQKNLLINFELDRWEPLLPGKTYGKYNPSGFGPEVSFAAALSTALNEPIGIIKHSQAGTTLGQWHKNGNLYGRLTKIVQKAKATKKIEIIAMIWMQGESDSKDQAMAEKYKAKLESLIQRCRDDFESPNMIFIAGRVNPQGERFAYTDIVRLAQETCSATNYAYIDCDSLPKVGDGVHYNTVGIVEMGQRFADKLASRL